MAYKCCGVGIGVLHLFASTCFAALYVLCIIAETPPLYDTTDSSVCDYAQTASLFLHQLHGLHLECIFVFSGESPLAG